MEVSTYLLKEWERSRVGSLTVAQKTCIIRILSSIWIVLEFLKPSLRKDSLSSTCGIDRLDDTPPPPPINKCREFK